MNVLIKSVKVVDSQSPHNGKQRDVLVEDGRISQIAASIDVKKIAKLEVIDGKGQCISPGWFDMNVNFCDPGMETREDLQSGMAAAMAGGFTGVACMPNTQPAIHSKSEVSYIIDRTKNNLVDVFPLGAISREREGKDMAELFDMKQAGAVAFSDGNRPVADAGLLSRALLYVKGFNGLIISYADEHSISNKGKMNEGVTSTLLGVKGIPALAEELMIARDIALAEYTESRIHFTTVSTAGAVALIRDAKKKGISVSADVSAHHISLNDEILSGFDTQYKVKPPLRTKEDVKALKAGLKDGTIDCICSQHTPEDKETKMVEFEIASYGMLGLQTSFALANNSLQTTLNVETLIEKMAINPRKILGIEIPQIKEGGKANFTLFDTSVKWKLEEKDIRSKSVNSPFIGTNLVGKATGVFNNNNWVKL